MKPTINHPKMSADQVPEVRDFAQWVGKFVQYWGFKSVQGRIWCYLFLSDRPLSSRELAQLSKTSPSLVTQSLQVLLEYRVVLRAGKGRNGNLLFRANPNAAEAVLKVLKTREARLLAKLTDSAGRLTKRPGSRRRITDPGFKLDRARSLLVTQWIELASALLSSALEIMDHEKNPFTRSEELTGLW